jgi:hypothetical protein
MQTTSFILRHINSLPVSQLFSTRDLLCYGGRSAVDKALSRLVKRGYIERYARGVFMKASWGSRKPSPLDIASTKARAFGKIIFQHFGDFAARLGLINPDPTRHTFDTTGYTSSFLTKYGAIQFKKIGPRKAKLGDSTAGLIARTLWHIGKEICTADLVQRISAQIDRESKRELRESAGLVPAWLNSQFQEVITWQPRLMVRSLFVIP